MKISAARASAETMTSRERILATFRGEEVDRFPVWLKMANRTWQSSQPEPYRSMDAEALLRAAGCDLMLHARCSAKKQTPHVEQSVTQTSGIRRTTMRTPDGVLVGEETFDPYTESWHPTKFAGDTLEHFRSLRWLFADTSYTVDASEASSAAARQSELEAKDAISMASIGPGPLMNLIEHVCGPVQTTYYMYDEPSLFSEILELMHADRMRHLEALLPHLKVDTFWLTENTSTTLISPGMFEDFCVEHLRAYGELIIGRGIVAVHHMCGLLNALLETIDALPTQVNEAYTTRPLGDVSLAEGRARMPSKTLIGGTNATLWLEPVEKIVETVAADLADCADRRKIFLTSAGVLPPPVSFDKARQVVEAFKRL